MNGLCVGNLKIQFLKKNFIMDTQLNINTHTFLYKQNIIINMYMLTIYLNNNLISIPLSGPSRKAVVNITTLVTIAAQPPGIVLLLYYFLSSSLEECIIEINNSIKFLLFQLICDTLAIMESECMSKVLRLL